MRDRIAELNPEMVIGAKKNYSQVYFPDLMVDIETLSDETDAVILSIGMVQFDKETGETGLEFYEKIDIQDQLDKGLKVTGSTIQWWMMKPEEVRKEVFDPSEMKLTLREALERATNFLLVTTNADTKMWAKSPSFDAVRIENAYRKIGLKAPWQYQQWEDVRTLTRLLVFESVAVDRDQLHKAVYDCHVQIKQVHKAYIYLKNKGIV